MFYYSKNEKNAFNAVHHMLQKTDAAGENLTQDENGTTVYQVVEVIAEAVQAEPISAAQEAWGVAVTNNYNHDCSVKSSCSVHRTRQEAFVCLCCTEKSEQIKE